MHWQEARKLLSESRTAEAIAAGERTLILERELFGNTHEELSKTLAWLSERFVSEQNMPQGEKYAVELQRVQESLHGPNGWQAVSARWRLDYVRKLATVEPATLSRMLAIETEANRLSTADSYTAAAAEIAKLIPLEESLLGSEHPFLANTFANQAEFLVRAEDWQALAAAAERALNIRRKVLGPLHRDTGMAAFLVAQSRIGPENHAEALDMLAVARDAFQASGQFADAAWMEKWRGDSLTALKNGAAARTAYEAALLAFGIQNDQTGIFAALKMLPRRELHTVIDDNFQKNSLPQYQTAGAVTWESAMVTLRGKGSIERSLSGGPFFAAQLTLHPEDGNLSDKALSVNIKLTNGSVIDVQLSPPATRQSQPARWLVTVSPKSPMDQPEPPGVKPPERKDHVREFIADNLDPSPLVLHLSFRHGLLELFSGPGQTPFAASYSSDVFDASPVAIQLMGNGVRLSHFRVQLTPYNALKSDLQKEQDAQAVEQQRLATRLYNECKYSAAIMASEKCRELTLAAVGTVHPDYATSLNNLAFLYEATGDTSSAEPMYLESLEISKTVLGDRHPEYAAVLNNLAALYVSAGNTARAEPLYLQAIEINKRVHGENHADYTRGLNNLGTLYAFAGEMAKAKRMYLQAMEITRDLMGEQHPFYATCLSNLAGLYESMADYANAEPLHIQSLDIRRATLGERHRDYASSLHNLAALYADLGDYSKSEAMSLKSSEIRKSVLGERHPEYALSLNNLAMLYTAKGEYAKAGPLYQQALDIRKEVLGVRHPLYAISLNNLALFHKMMGDFVTAEPLYIEAMEVVRSARGDRHPDFALVLDNLAVLYQELSDYQKAKSFYQMSLTIRKSALGDSHPDYATSLSNLALLYLSTGDNVGAEPLLLEATEVMKSKFGEWHPDYALGLHNLAYLYAAIGNFAKAESLYQQCLRIREGFPGSQHADYTQSLMNLAELYVLMKEPEKAEQLYTRVLSITRDLCEQISLIQSERQQLAMGRMLRYRLDSFVSFALNCNQFQASAAREVLRWKGATLVRQRAMRLAADDSAVSEQFSKLLDVSRRLSSLALERPRGVTEDRQQRIRDLTAEKERLETELSHSSSAFRAAMDELGVEQLQSAVPADCVLIDFTEFGHRRPAERSGWWNSTPSIVAVVLKPDAEPRLVDLGETAPLSKDIDTWRQTFGMSSEAQQAGQAIRRQIWEPLLPHIGAATTILVSADGVLGRLPLGALPGGEPGTFLIEDHRLAMIPVPRLLPALMSKSDSQSAPRDLLVLGDIDYNAAPTDTENSSPRPRKRRAFDGSAGELIDAEFQHLPGAAGEIGLIRQLHHDVLRSGGGKVVSLTQQNASEAAFRKVAGKCRQLHLATHGFFAPARVDSAFSAESIPAAGEFMTLDTAAGALSGSSSEQQSKPQDARVNGLNPDLLSGLALAGANLQPVPGEDDGILTAQEIAFLPLGGVDTVVLSACETGLGETAGGEGLIGIQRAFQIAGARTTVASFWRINDGVTKFLMERFYRNMWEKKMTRLDALREAQLYLLKNPAEVSALDRSLTRIRNNAAQTRLSPEFWAAFTLSGDWR
jgi:CHAT domain-containing protein/tetratricopeptide (TPR) repeat protein